MTAPFANPPRPGLHEELRALRAAEKASASNATMAQFLAVRMVALYGVDAEIRIDYEAKPGEWRHVDQSKQLLRHGRTDVLPPKALLVNRNCWPVWMAPDVAAGVVKRDGAAEQPGNPI